MLGFRGHLYLGAVWCGDYVFYQREDHGNSKKVLYEIVFYFDADNTPTIKRLVVGNVYQLIQGAVELGQ